MVNNSGVAFSLLFSIYNAHLLPCDRSWLLQRRGRVFSFRSCGPGSIPGGWDSSAPCDIWWPLWGSPACVWGIRMFTLLKTEQLQVI